MEDSTQNQKRRRAVELFRAAKRPLALTGAGISVESGIPDFRGSHGLWRKFDPREYATLDTFLSRPEKSWELFRALGRLLVGRQPNPAHRALAELERAGRLAAVITQNIDNLHQAAGSRSVVEVHGSHRHLHCLSCGHARPASPQDFEKREVPRCACGFPLKPQVVLFGELVHHMDRVTRMVSDCDVLLVMGTSAEVYPVAELPFAVARRGGQIIEFNLESTTLTRSAQLSLLGPCSRTVPRFVQEVLREQGDTASSTWPVDNLT